MANADSVPRLVRATPLVGLSAMGLGPFGPLDQRHSTFELFERSERGRWLALDSAGVVGRRLLVLAHVFGDGGLTAEQLRFQTQKADPTMIEAELARMVDAKLLSLGTDGTVRLAAAGVAAHLAPSIRSLADANAVTTDDLLGICRRLRIAAPSRKQDRLDAITAHFADSETAELARKELSLNARNLLARIAAVGPYPAYNIEVGVTDEQMYTFRQRRYARHTRPSAPAPANPLADLVDLGFVGVDRWEPRLWLWREAVPGVGSPLFGEWRVAPRPALVTSPAPPPQVPEFVATFDRAMRHWAQSPPATLKNNEPRLGKAVIASTAKALGSDPLSVDLASRLAIDLGLLLANTVAITGRGRDRRAEQVWLADPALAAAWDETPLIDRWARLVAAWCRPEHLDQQQQLQCNRHLVLWELAILDPAMGYDGDAAFTAWIAARHATLGHAIASAEVVAELRALGLAPTHGPLALTELARRLLDDPTTVADALGPAGTSVVVQGDLTILVPPGTDTAIRHRLADLALVESDGAAQVLRLDEARITRAVQAGATSDEIVAFLRQVSSVPLVDAVTRLVADAAARSHRVTLAAATTVVVVTDPADLVLACSAKAAKLQAVSDTVAVSVLPLDKVRAALDRKGLAPVLAGGADPLSAAGTQARSLSSGESLESLRRQAEQTRRAADRTGNPHLNQQAERLARMADHLADPRARLRVTGPLTLTPFGASELGSGQTGAGNGPAASGTNKR